MTILDEASREGIAFYLDLDGSLRGRFPKNASPDRIAYYRERKAEIIAELRSIENAGACQHETGTESRPVAPTTTPPGVGVSEHGQPPQTGRSVSHSAKFSDYPPVNTPEYASLSLHHKTRACLARWIGGVECWALQDRLSQLVEVEELLRREGNDAGLPDHLYRNWSEYHDLRKRIEAAAGLL